MIEVNHRPAAYDFMRSSQISELRVPYIPEHIFRNFEGYQIALRIEGILNLLKRRHRGMSTEIDEAAEAFFGPLRNVSGGNDRPEVRGREQVSVANGLVFASTSGDANFNVGMFRLARTLEAFERFRVGTGWETLAQRWDVTKVLAAAGRGFFEAGWDAHFPDPTNPQEIRSLLVAGGINLVVAPRSQKDFAICLNVTNEQERFEEFHLGAQQDLDHSRLGQRIGNSGRQVLDQLGKKRLFEQSLTVFPSERVIGSLNINEPNVVDVFRSFPRLHPDVMRNIIRQISP